MGTIASQITAQGSEAFKKFLKTQKRFFVQKSLFVHFFQHNIYFSLIGCSNGEIKYYAIKNKYDAIHLGTAGFRELEIRISFAWMAFVNGIWTFRGLWHLRYSKGF